MALELKPLPMKVRQSIDIPALLDILKRDGEFHTSATFEDLLVVRNYLTRHPELGVRLSQQRVWEGYVIRLKPVETLDD